MKKIFTAIFLILVFCGVSQAEDKHFLWKISRGESEPPVYLMGSMHLGKPDMYPLPDVIEEAFARSSAVVLEVDVESLDPAIVQSAMMEKGTYRNGGYLKDHVSPETFLQLKGRLAQFGLPLEQVAHLKPWLMAMMLSVLQMKIYGFDENYGIDHYFSLKAARSGKDVLQLESLEEQLEFMDSIEDQNKFLEYTLVSMDQTEQMLEQLMESWYTGDTAGMEKIVIADLLTEFPDIRPVLEILLFDRNRNMAGEIREFIDSGKNYFVIVGAAHLVGEEGVVELLRGAGYTVEQL